MRAHAKWLMTSLACAYGLIRLQRRQCGTDWGSIILFRHIYIYMHVCMYACMHVCRSGVTRLGLRLHLPIRLNEASTECRMYVHVREKPVSYVCIPPLRFRGITKLCIPLPFSRILPPLRERKISLSLSLSFSHLVFLRKLRLRNVHRYRQSIL